MIWLEKIRQMDVQKSIQNLWKRNTLWPWKKKRSFLTAFYLERAGNRIIPMSSEVYSLLLSQREYWMGLNKDPDFNIDGYKLHTELEDAYIRLVLENVCEKLLHRIQIEKFSFQRLHHISYAIQPVREWQKPDTILRLLSTSSVRLIFVLLCRCAIMSMPIELRNRSSRFRLNIHHLHQTSDKIRGVMWLYVNFLVQNK